MKNKMKSKSKGIVAIVSAFAALMGGGTAVAVYKSATDNYVKIEQIEPTKLGIGWPSKPLSPEGDYLEGDFYNLHVKTAFRDKDGIKQIKYILDGEPSELWIRSGSVGDKGLHKTGYLQAKNMWGEYDKTIDLDEGRHALTVIMEDKKGDVTVETEYFNISNKE